MSSADDSFQHLARQTPPDLGGLELSAVELDVQACGGLQRGELVEAGQEVGGTACIESAPGAGTYVELTIPSAAWNGSAPVA